jgi:peptide/histidine transporter 3/4
MRELPSAISMLQVVPRTKILLILRTLTVYRLHHLEDVDPTVEPVPLSLLWQLPQYFLVGTSQVFAMVGAMEVFYR